MFTSVIIHFFEYNSCVCAFELLLLVRVYYTHFIFTMSRNYISMLKIIKLQNNNLISYFKRQNIKTCLICAVSIELLALNLVQSMIIIFIRNIEFSCNEQEARNGSLIGIFFWYIYTTWLSLQYTKHLTSVVVSVCENLVFNLLRLSPQLYPPSDLIIFPNREIYHVLLQFTVWHIIYPRLQSLLINMLVTISQAC